MVNHRNISAGESRCRVQLASLSLGEIYAASQPFPLLCRPGAEIGIYNITKCCEVVTTLHEQFGQVECLWFDSHIVMVTIFIQPQLKTWPRFVPQSFVTSSVISVVSVAYTPASVHRSILF